MHHRLAVAALLSVAAAQVAAAQVAVPAVRFDGERGAVVAGILQQAVAARGEAPPVGAVRELSSGWSVEIGIGDPYPRYPGGQYGGSSWRWETVKRLAHEVQERAEHLHRWAEARSHHGGWEERFLRACHRFEQAARHFHRQVESYRQHPSHTQSDYYQLQSAFRDVEYSINGGHVDGHVRSDFYAASSAVNELASYYRGGYDDGHGGGHGGDHGGWEPYPRHPRPPRYPRRPRGRHGW
ncbi:MAG: hypothetical protein HY553_07010 [Elusimicrobia bacterium]|nr:hypothetical protein [Elusimicrobiota bacterium]